MKLPWTRSRAWWLLAVCTVLASTIVSSAPRDARRGPTELLPPGRVAASPAEQAPVAAHAVPAPPSTAFLDTYCITCHNQKLKTGGLELDGLDPSNPGPNAEVWEKVVVKLRAGLMPPSGMPRPRPPV